MQVHQTAPFLKQQQFSFLHVPAPFARLLSCDPRGSLSLSLHSFKLQTLAGFGAGRVLVGAGEQH